MSLHFIFEEGSGSSNFLRKSLKTVCDDNAQPRTVEVSSHALRDPDYTIETEPT